jgi:hypothetical protein
MTADPDPIGEDGTVRLRCYLPLADTHWFNAGCKGCGHAAPVSVQAAVQAMGTADATVGELARRLRCSGCGGRRVGIVVSADSRPAWVRQREGMAETRAGGST